MVYPLVLVYWGSFWTGGPGNPGQFTVQGYIRAYDPAALKALGNTLWLAVVRTILGTAIGVLFAWLLTRTRFPFKGTIEVFIWLHFFLPFLPMGLAWLILLGPGYGLINHVLAGLGLSIDIYSYGGIIWVWLPFIVSITVIMVTPVFRLMDASLEESARMSGASVLGTFLRVTVPISLPGVLAPLMLGLVKSLDSFEIELLLGYPKKIYVYTTRIYDLLRYSPPNYNEAMALSAVFLAAVVIIIFAYRGYIGRRHFATVTGRGFVSRPISLGKWQWVVFAMFVVYILVFTLLPTAALGLGSFMRKYGVFSAHPFTTEHWTQALGQGGLLSTLGNTLILGFASAALGILAYSLISYIVIRTKWPGRGTLDFISWLPWAVPGMVLALGMLWTHVGGPLGPLRLYGSLWLLIIAVIVKQLPFGIRQMNASMIQLSAELEEAARIHGASWLYTFRSVVVPLLAPAFVSAGVVMFLMAVRELITVVLLYSPRSKVLSILGLEFYMAGLPEMAMVVSFVLTAIIVIVALLARRLGLRQVM